MNKLSILGDKAGRYFHRITSPRSKDKDAARREFILNVILLGTLTLTFIISIRGWIDHFFVAPHYKREYITPPVAITAAFLFFVYGYILSRAGRFRVVAYALIGVYFFGTAYTSYLWGVTVPQALLIYALLIIMSGILLSSRIAFLLTIIISLLLITLVYLTNAGLVVPDLSWRKNPPNLQDVSVYSVTLFIIALISWLFNREMEKSLKRARLSEAALRRQRDQLEITVDERTQELKQAQAEKLMQMYRFAEVGKYSLGLFHDFANPLNLVYLNLNSLRNKRNALQPLDAMQTQLESAMLGTEKLKTFLEAVKRQGQSQNVRQQFSLKKAINQSIQVLSYKAKRERVKIILTAPKDIKLYGNPIKFDQVITNLLSNGIDAYDGVEKKERIIEIVMRQVQMRVVIIVEDFGCGIDKKDLPCIFDPLFTTKGIDKGTGIGLAICKDAVQKDLRGTITVSSEKGKGSRFTLSIPLTLTSKLTDKRTSTRTK